MIIRVDRRCSDFQSYRAARVKSLFNVESGCDFNLTVDVPVEESDWQIGLIVGPSGSGKSSLAKEIWPDVPVWNPAWPDDQPIVDAISPDGDFDQATASLSAVGLGSVPSWLRPHRVLSNGEQFRANMARAVADHPPRLKLDEFTSVVDRQVAQIGAAAFARAWRRGTGQAICFTCHYDVVDWLDPCWVIDLRDGSLTRRSVRRRPPIELKIIKTDWRYWSQFQPHHYLKLPKMIAAYPYVGFVGDEPVAHVAFTSRPGLVEARAARLVVMPEWQGVGIGTRFLGEICRAWRDGRNPYRRRLYTLFNTSHPGLCAALRRRPEWEQISASLCGSNADRSRQTLRKAGCKSATGFGGHFRAIQGFRYYGDDSIADRRAIKARGSSCARGLPPATATHEHGSSRAPV